MFSKKNLRPVEIIDTTLREGMQSPLWDDSGKYFPNSEEILLLFEALAKYGVHFVEVFSPNVGKKENENLKKILKKRDEFFSKTGKYVAILVHVRCHPKDIEAALKYKIDGLNFYIGTSNQSQKFNHGSSLKEAIEQFVPLISTVRQNRPSLLLRFSGEDAFRTKLKDLFYVYDAVAPFVDRIGLPDTVGTSSHKEVSARISFLKKRYPKTEFECHFHNDRGLSLANALAAVEAGARFIDTSILGLGERSGITSVTSLLFNIFLDNPELVEGFDLSSSYELNVLLAKILGWQVPCCEPVSLTNRTHSAGVHVNAVLKNPKAYEGLPLDKFGVSERKLLLGPLSGHHTVSYFVNEVLDYQLSDEQAKKLLLKFKKRVVEMKKGETPILILEKLVKEAKLPRHHKKSTHLEDLSES